MRRVGIIMTLALIAAICGPVGGLPVAAAKPTGKGAKLIINIPPPERRTIKGLTHPPLSNVRFHLGAKVSLDRAFDPAGQAAEGCIDKPATGARFCMDPVDWPAAVMAAMELADDDDTIYRGGRAVIRYDAGHSSQVHVLFPASAFIDVVEHLKTRYGPPTEQEINVQPVPGEVELVNTVVRWKSITGPALGDKDMILEVRAYDDVRHPHPDRLHGFVWLHRAGAVPVFRHFTTIDMMLLRQRRLGRWPAEEDAGD